MTTTTPLEDAEHRDFRMQLRRFLVGELTEEVRARHMDPREYGGWSPAYLREFRRKLGSHGYIGVGWPAEYGGGGRDMTYEVIFADEMEYAGAPGLDRTVTYVPQAIIAFGTHAQKELLLPRLRHGEIAMSVAYSEAEAGSDLAALSVEATPTDGGLMVRGEKFYCSQAHIADYAMTAVRTRRSPRKHDGISLLIVDMSDPRVRVTAHPTVAGWDHHSVYFDDVVVPDDMVLGPLHEGWRVLMGAIDHERAGLSAPGEVDRQLDRLVTWARDHRQEQRPLLDDDAVADQLVGLAIEQEAARAYAYEVAERQSRGERVQHETSLAVLLKREAARAADRLGLELLGPAAQLTRTSPYAEAGGVVEHQARDHIYYSFAAGGFDITRNVIARRALELPREGQGDRT